jgi:hypothetical protein
MLLEVSAQSLHIAIDVAVTGEHVCGHVSDGVGQPKPFSGWLALIVALDEILAPPPACDAEPNPRAGEPAVRDRSGPQAALGTDPIPSRHARHR